MESAAELIEEIKSGLKRMEQFAEIHRIFIDLKGENLTFDDIWKIKEEYLTFLRDEINREIRGKPQAPGQAQIRWPFAR